MFAMLCNFRCKNNTIVDTCGNSWANLGSSAVVLGEGRFSGGQSMIFNGSSYLKGPIDTKFDLGTDVDFTIATWIKYNTGNSYPSIIGRDSDYGSKLSAAYGGYKPYAAAGHAAAYQNFISNILISNPTNAWHFLTFSRKNKQYFMSIDGAIVVAAGISTYSFDMSLSKNILIGWDGFQSNSSFFGYLDDLTVVKGLGLFTGAFTPPTDYLSFGNIAYEDSLMNLYGYK